MNPVNVHAGIYMPARTSLSSSPDLYLSSKNPPLVLNSSPSKRLFHISFQTKNIVFDLSHSNVLAPSPPKKPSNRTAFAVQRNASLPFAQSTTPPYISPSTSETHPHPCQSTIQFSVITSAHYFGVNITNNQSLYRTTSNRLNQITPASTTVRF